MAELDSNPCLPPTKAWASCIVLGSLQMKTPQPLGKQNYWPGCLPLNGVTSLQLKKQMMKKVLGEKRPVYKHSLIN